MAVKWYGETEFWAALGKMLLIIGLIIYTFITMLGKSKHCIELARVDKRTNSLRWQPTRRPLRIPLLERTRLVCRAVLRRRFGPLLGFPTMSDPCLFHHRWSRLRSHGRWRSREPTSRNAASIQRRLLPLDMLLRPWKSVRWHQCTLQRPRAYCSVRERRAGRCGFALCRLDEQAADSGLAGYC